MDLKILSLISLCLAFILIGNCHSSRMKNKNRNETPTRRKCETRDRESIQGPKSLNDRIAIVGAGPSSIHMAVLLKDKGFKNIDIYEKGSRIGGKAMTVMHSNAPQELGACCMGPGYENNVIALIKRFAPDQLVPRKLASVWTDDLATPIRYDQYIARESMKHFQTNNATIAMGKLVQEMKHYIEMHRLMFGDYDFELMPRPSEKIMSKCRGNFLDFLKQYQLDSLVPLFVVSHTLQGYDYLDRINAFYGLMWNPPSLLNGFLAILGGDATPKAFLTKNGFQTFWETVAKKSNLRIHYNTNIRKVKRRRSGISLCLCKSRRCHKHDFVIWSPELKGSLKYFDRPTRKEKQIFSKMYSRYLISTLVDVIGGVRAPAATEYFIDNMNKKRDRKIWAARNSYESINGRDAQAAEDAVRSYITYQSRAYRPSDAETRLNVVEHFKSRQAKSVAIVKHEIWKYFPHFPDEDIVNGVLWDILNMQGEKKMWYIGSSVSFESLKSVIEYNKLLVSKMTAV